MGLRVAIIGAGQVARASHINHYQNIAGVEVVAVSDVNETAARETATIFGIACWYCDAETMLRKVQPEAVSICVPNKFHCEITCLALAYGCHVLCEKPPAITVDETKQMRDMAQKYDRILTYGFHFRHAKRVDFLKKKIDAGELGTVYAGEAVWMRRRGIPNWGNFTNRGLQGGGPLIDIGIHILDLATYLMNYPVIDYICATSSDRIGKQGGNGLMGSWNGEHFGVEDGLFGFVKFADGSSLQVRTAFAINISKKEQRSLYLYGDKKGLSVFPTGLYGEEDGQQENRVYPFDEIRDWHYDCIKHFVDCCTGHAKPLVTPRQAIYVQQMISCLYHSAEVGKPVAWQ